MFEYLLDPPLPPSVSRRRVRATATTEVADATAGGRKLFIALGVGPALPSLSSARPPLEKAAAASEASLEAALRAHFERSGGLRVEVRDNR
jgi:hypothetical protein